ncbi:MAG: hypothetical protein QNK20_16495, partial [Aureibaculum sp.]|nr:hypothetical protein [Aureibaculum sp.]
MAETYGVVKASLDTNINANGANANSGGGANTSITKVLDLTNALPYDDTRTYEADSSLIIRLGKLYICNTTIGVPEPFNASKWDVLTSASNSGEQALTDSVEATIIFAVA